MQRAGIKHDERKVLSMILTIGRPAQPSGRCPRALRWDERRQPQGNRRRVAGRALEAVIRDRCRAPLRPQRPDPTGQARGTSGCGQGPRWPPATVRCAFLRALERRGPGLLPPTCSLRRQRSLRAGGPWPLRCPVAIRVDASAWAPVLRGRSGVKSWAAGWREGSGRERTSPLGNKARFRGAAGIPVAAARRQSPRHARQGPGPERAAAVPLPLHARPGPARSQEGSRSAPKSYREPPPSLPPFSRPFQLHPPNSDGPVEPPAKAGLGGGFLYCFLFGNCH